MVMIDVRPASSPSLVEGQSLYTLRYGALMQAHGPAWTAVGDDGRVLAVAGLTVLWEGAHACAWAHVATIGKERFPLIRAMRQILDAQPFAAIEARARAREREECRMLEAIGFRYIGQHSRWGPNAEPYNLYERLT